MILRIGHAIAAEASGQDAWQALAKTQQTPPANTSDRFIGCISQTAHAALAARLAAALMPDVFGVLLPEIIEAIGRHDAGWAELDLAALENVGEKQPQSFMTYPPEAAVRAWRKSIRQAEALSPLAGILTSRHFCLLAPLVGDPHHETFRKEENQRRDRHEAASPLSRDDLDRFTAALGFCDLLSLCLCSGLTGTVQMQLAHAADPASRHAPRVTVSIANETNPDQTLCFNPPTMTSGTAVYADGWLLSTPNTLASYRWRWIIG